MTIDGLKADGNLTKEERQHFIGNIIPDVLKSGIAEAHEFTRRGLDDFIKSDWGDKNTELLENNGGIIGLQKALIKAKKLPQGADDGHFGPITLSALINFQKEKKLKDIDGIAGPETVGALGLGIETPKISREKNKVFKGIDISQLGPWGNIFKNFLQVAQSCDSNCNNYGKTIPALISDRNQLACVYQGQVISTMHIIGGEGGYANIDDIQDRDKKTPVGLIHRFKPGAAVKYGREWDRHVLAKGESYFNPDLMPADNGTRRNLVWDERLQSYFGEIKGKNNKWHKKRVTVVGVSIQSPESLFVENSEGERVTLGGRYFHLVGPGRSKTHGCVGVAYKDREKFKQVASLIERLGGAGFVA